MLARLSQTIPRSIGHHARTAQSVRNYLGDAGPMQKSPNEVVTKREEALWQKAQPRYDDIMERHIRLPTVDDIIGGEGTKKERELEVRKKRLVYRSKQRGWLEVDLLLGTWAAQNVPQLSLDELNEFEKFVNLETIDIYNVLTLRTDIPQEMEGSVVEKIQAWAKNSPLGKANREKYSEMKKMNNLI